MRKYNRLGVAIVLLALSSCSLPGFKPYKIEVQQGNVVTQHMASALKLGMTQADVRYALGTPLLTDIFHRDRWDYIYIDEKGGKLVARRRLTLFFKDGRLVRVAGDVVPSGQVGGAS
ncbi:MAG: outer membrane protein assembly factor BamE [Betaproteobacteria bacterium]|nr:outer membrane protein assembly factor BamE [Betaproteobacteria bacterium]